MTETRQLARGGLLSLRMPLLLQCQAGPHRTPQDCAATEIEADAHLVRRAPRGDGGGFLSQGHCSKYKGRHDLVEGVWIGNPKTWAPVLKPLLLGHVIWDQVAEDLCLNLVSPVGKMSGLPPSKDGGKN